MKIFFEIFFEKIIKKEKKPLLLLPRNLAGVLDSSKKLYFCIRLSSGISKTSKPDHTDLEAGPVEKKRTWNETNTIIKVAHQVTRIH